MVKDGYNGLLAEVRIPENLAAKIESLLIDENRKEIMGENSRQELEKMMMVYYLKMIQQSLMGCLLLLY